jgi:HK97 family phage major capsid protein
MGAEHWGNLAPMFRQRPHAVALSAARRAPPRNGCTTCELSGQHLGRPHTFFLPREKTMTFEPMLSAARKNRKRDLAKMEKMLAKVDSAGRKNLNRAEEKEFEKLVTSLREADTNIERLASQVHREGIATAAQATVSAPAESRLQNYVARAYTSGKDLVYAPGNGQSYFRDLAAVGAPSYGIGQIGARERLTEHARLIERAAPDLPDEFRATANRGNPNVSKWDNEQRVNPNTTYGTGGEFVPPVYLIAQYVKALRAGRVVADRVTKSPLPPGTDSINIPKVNQATLTAPQGAQGGAVASRDLTTLMCTSPVITIAGQSDVALQLIEQTPINFDEVIYTDLLADLAQKIDVQVLSGIGPTVGQLTGMLNVVGTNAITFTSASPTVPLLYPYFAQATTAVAKNRFMAPDTIAMHPSTWGFIVAALDSQTRPLVGANGQDAFNTISIQDTDVAEGIAGRVAGLPVILDANIPNSMGTGSNQAPILVGRFSDFMLWESTIRLRALQESLSGTLQVRYQAYQYLAFIGNRYPTALSVINGTGLIVQPGF